MKGETLRTGCNSQSQSERLEFLAKGETLRAGLRRSVPEGKSELLRVPVPCRGINESLSDLQIGVLSRFLLKPLLAMSFCRSRL